MKALYEQLLRDSQEEQARVAQLEDEHAERHCGEQATIIQLETKLETYKARVDE